MKKAITVLIFLILMNSVFAQEIVDPGVMPGSLFYGLDLAIEKIQLSLAGRGEPKARLHLAFAEERLAEVQALVNDNRISKVQDVLLKYEEQISKVDKEINAAKGIGLDVSNLVKEIEVSNQKQLTVLELVSNKVPERAQPTINKVITDIKTKTATKKEAEQKAGIDITGAVTGTLTQEELEQVAEQLRQKEEELKQKEEELAKKASVPAITGLTIAEREQLLSARMGIIFVIALIGIYVYFHYITRKHLKKK